MVNRYVKTITGMLVAAAISYVLISFLGLIIGLILSFAVFVLMNMIVERKLFRSFRAKLSPGIKYRCIQCGYRFRGSECPRCGSKMRKAEF